MTTPLIGSDEIQKESGSEGKKTSFPPEFQANETALPRGSIGVERPLSVGERPETCKEDWSGAYSRSQSSSAKVEGGKVLDMNQDPGKEAPRPAIKKYADGLES